MKDSVTARFAAVSCPHFPYAREESLAFVFHTLEKQKGLTHFVVLGDLFEAKSASVHSDEEVECLLSNYAAAAKFYEDLQDVLPADCERVWCLGNHDDNIQVSDFRRIPKSLRKLVHWNNTLVHGAVFKRWKQIPYVKGVEGCYQLGQVIFYHGYDAGNNSDETEGLQMAMACGGHAHRLTVRGHTHRPLGVTQASYSAKVMLPYWYANAGTLGPLKPGYMQRKDTSLWGPGMVVGSCEVARPSRMRQGPQWEAELLVP